MANKTLGYSLLGIGGAIGGYYIWKKSQNGGNTSVTWMFPAAGAWAQHLPDNFAESIILADLINVPAYVQQIAWYDTDAGTWLFWSPDAPGTTLSVLVAGENYLIAVTEACEWTISLVEET